MDFSSHSTGFFQVDAIDLSGDYPAMRNPRKTDPARLRLAELVNDNESVNLKSLSLTLGMGPTYLQDYLDGSPRELRYEYRVILAGILGVEAEELAVTKATQKLAHNLVATKKHGVQPSSGDKARRGSFDELSIDVPVIGSVQAGAWMEAIQLPETEWRNVTVPADVRYPGIERLGWKNLGSSMDKKFEDGATLVCVRYDDANEHPQPGDYVIVEREDWAGKVEATCKRYVIEGGKPCLKPESHDPRFKSFAMAGDKNIKEIRIIARVIDAINRVGGRL